MRYIIISFIVLLFGFVFLKGQFTNTNNEKPIFLKIDSTSYLNHPKINLTFQSSYIPNKNIIAKLKKDYANLWAHLNILYSTNNKLDGKEFYTEDFFKTICKNENPLLKTIIQRQDIEHHLYIKTMANDDLLYTAIDSNIIFKYTLTLNNKKDSVYYSLANVAIILLLQGDHWRLDAIQIINETKL